MAPEGLEEAIMEALDDLSATRGELIMDIRHNWKDLGLEACPTADEISRALDTLVRDGSVQEEVHADARAREGGCPPLYWIEQA